MGKYERLGFLLFRAFHTHWRVSNARLQKRGITPGQPKVLGFLERNDGCIQRELAQHCCFQAASVSGVLSSMEREGLIRREQDPTDRRVLRVHITDKGRCMGEFCRQVMEELDEAAMAGFSPQERQLAAELLRRIGDNLNAQSEENELEPSRPRETP